MLQAIMFGSILAARVAHCWPLSLVPHPCDPACPPAPLPPLARPENTHRHGSVSLLQVPWWGSGVVSSLDGCETR